MKLTVVPGTRLRRTGGSTHRVTYGKYYEVKDNGRTIDDKGRYITPTLRDAYWVIEPTSNYASCGYLLTDTQMRQELKGEFIKTNGETAMKIEKTTLINGQKESDLEINTLLKMIEDELEKIERLKNINVQSKAIDALKKKHNDNIEQLTEILDAREV